MNYDDGRVRIDECPLCLETHEYDVQLITKAMQCTLSDNQEADRCGTPTTASYYCPNMKKEFEQEVVAIHRAYEFVRDMKTRLVGLEDEATDAS